MNAQNTKSLEALARCIEAGVLTKALFIEEDTLVCVTQRNQDGTMAYHQLYFKDMPSDWQKLLKGHTVGDSVANCKVMGVYDVWDIDDMLGNLDGLRKVSNH